MESYSPPIPIKKTMKGSSYSDSILELLKNINHKNLDRFNNAVIRPSKSESRLKHSDANNMSMSLQSILNNSYQSIHFDNMRLSIFLQISQQLVEAVEYLHDMHYYHGNISPENITFNVPFTNIGELNSPVINAKKLSIKLGGYHYLSNIGVRKISYGANLVCKSPENVLRINNFDSKENDLWMIAATLYIYCTGKPIVNFRRVFKSNTIPEHSSVYFNIMGEYTGDVPIDVMKEHIDKSLSDAFKTPLYLVRKSATVQNILKGLLKTEPDERMQLSEVMKIIVERKNKK